MEAQDGNQLERALAFLQRQLATGARPAKDLYEIARNEHGISRAMVWLAKKDLGIVDERIGFGRGSVVHWRLGRRCQHDQRSMQQDGGTVSRESQTEKGVRDAWDFWLSQHDVSVPAIIEAAVREAVGAWMDAHGGEIVERAAREALVSTLVVPGTRVVGEEEGADGRLE